MKYRLVVVFPFLVVFQSFGQDINEILVAAQQADEPPTNAARPRYTINFKRNGVGVFVAGTMRKNETEMKANTIGTIEKDRILHVAEWIAQDKNHFTQDDLEIAPADLIQRLKVGSYNLNFGIPADLIVHIDSFRFCQSYEMTRTISTGGETIEVYLKIGSGKDKQWVFETTRIGTKDFDLQGYVICFKLLQGKLPREFPQNGFFARDTLLDILLRYQKTVECEGYYYTEYLGKHPELTTQEKRMKSRWIFAEYMKNRNK